MRNTDKYAMEVTPLRIHGEKVSGAGEDSLLSEWSEWDDALHAGIIACLDGCGGAGSRKYSVSSKEMTGARLGAMYVGKTVREWFMNKDADSLRDRRNTSAEYADEIRQEIQKPLQWLKKNYSGQAAIQSRLSREFPTTLAAVLVASKGSNKYRYISLWAGDSRTFLLKPSGLQQTSRDQIRGNDDPFDAMMKDDVLSNVICADRDFSISTYETEVEGPHIVLAASDGCFSYLGSPILIECILLDTMMNAATPAEWENKLDEFYRGNAQDDYSMAIAILGFPNWRSVQEKYHPRLEYLKKAYIPVLQDALKKSDVDAHYRLWQQYKPEYLPEEVNR